MATPHTTPATQSPPALAVLGFELTPASSAPADMRLLPAGEFRAWDGRPTTCDAWVLTDEDGQRLVAEAAQRASACVIDYEHATLVAKATGQAAPAAGWYRTLEWRAGDGVWAIAVDWTALAAQQISDHQYRYISPVFSFDPVTGRVLKLFHCSLTNDPGLDGLTDLAALAAQLLPASGTAADASPQPTSTTTAAMDELIERLQWMLNMPVGATPQDICDQLDKIKAQLQTAQAAGQVACSANGGADLLALVQALLGERTQLAALSSQVATLKTQATQGPDLTQYVALSAHAAVQGQLTALQAQVQSQERDALVKTGLDDGRIVKATEDYWRTQPVAALSAYLQVAQPLAALTSTQTGTQGTPGARAGALDKTNPDAIAAAAASYVAECERGGTTVPYAAAVSHVMGTNAPAKS